MQTLPLLIFNLTPDSFSDGSELNSSQDVKEKFLNFKNLGITHFDFGACSTAPMNEAIAAEIEWQRFTTLFLPLLEVLEDRPEFHYSFDTFYPENIKKICAKMINFKKAKIIWNDVSGVFDEQTLDVLRDNKELQYVFNFTDLKNKFDIKNHRRFCTVDPEESLINKMNNSFTSLKKMMEKKNLSNKTYHDPGIGFAKSAIQDWQLVESLLNNPKDYNYLIGISRKSFFNLRIGKSLDNKEQMDARESMHLDLLKKYLSENFKIKTLWRLHDPEIYFKAKNLCSLGKRL